MALFLHYHEERAVKENNAPALRKEVCEGGPALQTQAAGQPCHNFFCIFRSMRKVLPLTVNRQFCSDMSPGTSAPHSVQELGTQQWLFCCITQAQSGISGVSSWVRKQNSSVRMCSLQPSHSPEALLARVLLVITSFLLELS